MNKIFIGLFLFLLAIETLFSDRLDIDSAVINSKLDFAIGRNKKEVVQKPVLSVTEARVNFGSTKEAYLLKVSNSGTGELDWVIASDSEWITLSTDRGIGLSLIKISVLRTNLEYGHYSGIVKILSNGGETTIVIYMDIDAPKSEVEVEAKIEVKVEPKKVISKAEPIVVEKTGRWILADTVEDVKVFDSVWFNSSNDGYAVGTSTTLCIGSIYYGVIYHWDGKSWEEQSLPSSVYQLHSIYFLNANNGYAVGNYGNIIHYNGSKWVKMKSPTNSYIDISPIATDDIWAYSGNVIHHWNGTTWKDVKIDISTIKDIEFIAENDGYVLGSKGEIYHYNGFGWEFVNPLPSTEIKYAGFHFIDSSLGWLIVNGYLFNYKNNIWEKSDDFVRIIHGVSKNNIWGLPKAGSVSHFDGKSWNEMSTPTKENLNGIFMFNNREGWAVGDNGVILRYDVGK